jgi:hypothetical protein
MKAMKTTRSGDHDEGIEPTRDYVLSRTENACTVAKVFRLEEALEELARFDAGRESQPWWIARCLLGWTKLTPLHPSIDSYGPVRVVWFDHAVLISRTIAFRPSKAA